MIYPTETVMNCGTKGTYSTEAGGVGLGYKMADGSVVKSGGNGLYYPVDGLAGFWPDGGAAYMAAVIAFLRSGLAMVIDRMESRRSTSTGTSIGRPFRMRIG